jgi:hypothetical protein
MALDLYPEMVAMTEAMLIRWGWFLWNCNRTHYPITWNEFDIAIRASDGLCNKWHRGAPLP